jgi:hypothetical protein
VQLLLTVFIFIFYLASFYLAIGLRYLDRSEVSHFLLDLSQRIDLHRSINLTKLKT